MLLYIVEIASLMAAWEKWLELVANFQWPHVKKNVRMEGKGGSNLLGGETVCFKAKIRLGVKDDVVEG